jgi:hypothetical protein
MRLHHASLLALVFAACSAPVGDEETGLPGDIDHAPPSADGKSDAWDHDNDPARMSRHLRYRLDDLPLAGRLQQPLWARSHPEAVGKAPVAWADSYWPSARGSTNARWQGPAIPSPLEKYDAAFNDAPGCAEMPAQLCGEGSRDAWSAYLDCAGPAARWQMMRFQSIADLFDGRDNDRDGSVDECDDGDDEGPQGWWGLCHAWTVAALLTPEPQHAVEMGGQRFEVADIKALVQTIYNEPEALRLGGRCHATVIVPDDINHTTDECTDVNPGALHVVVANFLGLGQGALAMDRTATAEVWNQPIVGYEVLAKEEVTPAQALACIGAGEAAEGYTFNGKARALYEVTLRVDYLVEGKASAQPLGLDGYVASDSYHYILELGSTGKVIGGRYCLDSASHHPDNLWAPLGRAKARWAHNPNLDAKKVEELLARAL